MHVGLLLSVYSEQRINYFFNEQTLAKLITAKLITVFYTHNLPEGPVVGWVGVGGEGPVP